MPIYPVDGTERKGTIYVPEDNREAFDAECMHAKDHFPHQHPGEAPEAIALALVALLPRLDIVHIAGDEEHTDFHWARARCLFAGFGWHLHKRIAAACTDLYPVCDLDPDEDQETWQRKLTDAHRMSGWPAGLALLRWRRIAYTSECAEHPDVSQLHLCLATLHILKHLRLSPRYGLVCTFRGSVVRLDLDRTTNTLGSSAIIAQKIYSQLGAPANRGKARHAQTAAVAHMLAVLTTDAILRRTPLAEVPGTVVAGPWSMLAPDPMQNDGFIQHGLRLTNVWAASEGKVSSTAGDTDDVITYDWPMEYTGAPGELVRFVSSIPATYDQKAYPSDVLVDSFPNLTTDNYSPDPRVFLTLFDAVMASTVIANGVADLRLEKPLILCMPRTPSLDESTNQGKTKCSHMLARAASPGIPSIGISDTDDAAGRRSLAATVTQYGTLCAQEWRQPKSKTHLLSHENLQILLTGGSVQYGVAYSNEAASISLALPMFVDAKALDVPPDIVNRSLVLWLDALTDEQRMRPGILADIESGRTSLRMRFAAVAICEQHDLCGRANRAERVTSKGGWRFPVLRTIARMLWSDRYGAGEESLAPLDLAFENMINAHRGHTASAADNGVLAVLESSTIPTLSLLSIFEDMTIQTLTSVVALARLQSQGSGGKISSLAPLHLLRSIAEATGHSGHSIGRAMEAVVGARMHFSDRVLCIALSRSIKFTLPKVGDKTGLPNHLGLAGWRMIRRPDLNSAPRIDILAPGEVEGEERMKPRQIGKPITSTEAAPFGTPDSELVVVTDL